MPKYYRNENDPRGIIYQDQAGKETPVVVVPLADWRELVGYFQSWLPSATCEGACAECDEDHRIKTIIQQVEKDNA